MNRVVGRLHRWGVFAASLLFAVGAFAATPSQTTASAETVALAIVYDTSGSMRQLIGAREKSARRPKDEIARRALGTVFDRLEAFTTGPAAKPLLVTVVVFKGKEASTAQPLAPFNAAQLRTWLRDLPDPDNATPLGEALFTAGRDLLAAPAASRHLLVLTDGANTTGRSPEAALDLLQKQAIRQEQTIFTHIIALDLDPSTFAKLQSKGANVIAAADEAQLNARFDFILEEKILVEAP